MGKLLNSPKAALILLAAFIIGFAPVVKASEPSISCSNRYLTLVNPVRGRDLWSVKTLEPLKTQYAQIAKYSFPATWLLQYDALNDAEVASEVVTFNSNQEIGALLEISPKLANDSGVIYPLFVKWSDPGAVFLSAYSQPDRKKLIDTLFGQFKKKFGKYPVSVGAWWIDSFSLNYMVDEYKVKSALIVADQKTTDNYGVWGQWWGFAYKPSKWNILTPATDKKNKLNAVVIQWAQRDSELAYGEGPLFSNNSLQANDYKSLGKSTNYFQNLVSDYLDCQNKLAQITVGLETGMESVSQFSEYQTQLKYLSSIKSLSAVTMADFSKAFSGLYSINPSKITFDGWTMTQTYRRNEKLGDSIGYNPDITFGDHFIKDSSSFLDRRLPLNNKSLTSNVWFLAVLLLFLIYALRTGNLKVWFIGLLFSLAGYGLFLRSGYAHGWKIFFGPVVSNIELVQMSVVIASFAMVWIVNKLIRNKLLLLWLLPLSFGFDWLLSLIRYTKIDSESYFGTTLGTFRFLGIKFGQGFSFVNFNLSNLQAQTLLKFDFGKIWANPYLTFIVYPLVHLGIAILLWLILRNARPRLKLAVITILVALFLFQLYTIFSAAPRLVIPVL